MTIPYYEIAAFTSRHFSGNPAGVCILNEWLPDHVMQAIAAENNLAETAFVIEREKYFDIRWLTPAIEIDLCGHATLAAAHVVFTYLGRRRDVVYFHSPSGELCVERMNDRLVLDFPSRPAAPCDPPAGLAEALGAEPTEVAKGRDYLAVFDRHEDVAALVPDFEALARLDAQGVVVTAPGKDCDFVSRYFAPRAGIPEDPVTGSTHCVLIPYWSKRLGRKELRARQLSRRGGEVFCEDRGARVGIGGTVVLFMEGAIQLPEI